MSTPGVTGILANAATAAFFAWRSYRKDDYGGWMWWGGWLLASLWIALMLVCS